MMVRLNVSKNQKNAKKRGLMAMSGQLSSITNFGDISALTGGEDREVTAGINIILLIIFGNLFCGTCKYVFVQRRAIKKTKLSPHF